MQLTEGEIYCVCEKKQGHVNGRWIRLVLTKVNEHLKQVCVQCVQVCVQCAQVGVHVCVQVCVQVCVHVCVQCVQVCVQCVHVCVPVWLTCVRILVFYSVSNKISNILISSLSPSHLVHLLSSSLLV